MCNQRKTTGYRGDQMSIKAEQMYEKREQVIKQRGNKYTTPNIYKWAQMNGRTRQRTRGSIHYRALQKKRASKQRRCTRIKSKKYTETEKVCKHKPQMHKNTAVVKA